MILRPTSNKNCLLFQLNFFLIKSVCEERRESEILDLGRLMFSDDTFRRVIGYKMTCIMSSRLAGSRLPLPSFLTPVTVLLSVTPIVSLSMNQIQNKSKFTLPQCLTMLNNNNGNIYIKYDK